MKKYILVFSLLAIFLIKPAFAKDSYQIKFKFNNLKDTEIYLGYHFGSKKFISDTTQVDNKGIAIFKGKEMLPGGVYLMILPSKNFMEFIVAENDISIEVDTTDFISETKIIKSDENEVFYSYLNFIKEKSSKINEIRQKYDKETDEEKKKQLFDEMNNINIEISDFRKELIEKHQGLFIAKLLKSMIEPQPRQKEKNETDSAFAAYQYWFYQTHYFDNIDFSDERMLRTPVYEGKIDFFTERLSFKNPDSIKLSASRVIDLARANDEVFKYTLIKLFNKYATSEYMGMDAVFVHLAERYYLSGMAYWADSTQLKKIKDRVYKLSKNLIGMTAKPLIMKDTADQYHIMQQIDKPYTVVIFWDVSCGHCKKVLPKLKKIYKNTPKDSLEVYSVYIGGDLPAWRDYLRKMNFGWIDVSDPYNHNNFRDYYDVYSTPVVYLLDKDKKIIAKRIGVEQIKEIIDLNEGRPIPEKKDKKDKKDKSKKDD